MSSNPSAELNQAITDIGNALDVVDVLVVLLGICRRHASEVVAAGQDRAKRRQMRQEAARVSQAASAFTSRVLSPATKQLVIGGLQQATELAVTARAWALGIDLAMDDARTRVYSQLCAKPPTVRVLQDGDPYPTPSFDLPSMYGGAGLSRRPRRSAATAFDRLDGLALWPSASSQPLHVIYDTDAGTYLDAALGQRQTVNILAVVPNQDFIGEFGFTVLNNQFFDVHPVNTASQDQIIEDALLAASEHDVDIVVTPELSSTPNTVAMIKATLANIGAGRPPRVVIAGGSHIVAGKGRWNRMSTIYNEPAPVIFTHDKIGEYKFASTWEEDIDRSTEIRIHAGVNWSMITLICADLLDDAVVDAVADLCPRLVIVPSMSSKTGDFEMSMGAVIRKSQALAMVVNGPPDWLIPTNPPALSPANPTKKVTAPIVVIGMPLASSWILNVSPNPPPGAPYKVLFRSDQRQAHLI